MANKTSRPYDLVRSLVEGIGGTMAFKPAGQGGDWELRLHGRAATVSSRDNAVNALDALYVAKVAAPRTWEDFEPDAPLVADAFWQLVALMK